METWEVFELGKEDNDFCFAATSDNHSTNVTPPQVYKVYLESPKPQTLNIRATSDHIQAQDRASVTPLLPLLRDSEVVAFLFDKNSSFERNQGEH